MYPGASHLPKAALQCREQKHTYRNMQGLGIDCIKDTKIDFPVLSVTLRLLEESCTADKGLKELERHS